VRARRPAGARQGGYLLPIVLFASAAILIFVAAAYAAVMRQIDDVRQLGATGDFAIAKVSARAEVVYRLLTEPATVFGIGLAPDTAIRVDNRPYLLPSKTMVVRLQDAAGLIDVNRVELDVWRRLAEQVGVPVDQRDLLADRILDFLDEDDFRRLNGAERGEYAAARLDPPPNRAVESPRSLVAVLGWDTLLPGTMSDRFLGALTAGATGRVNPNAASPTVLYAMLGVPPIAAEDLVARRVEGFIDMGHLARVSTLGQNALMFAVTPVPSPVLLATFSDAATGRTERVRITLTPRAARWPWTMDAFETLPAVDPAALVRQAALLP